LQIGKIPDQVIRLAVLFAIAIAALIGARIVFVPRTFGELGHYRAAALDVAAGQQVMYAGTTACVDCHSDVAEVKGRSFHRGLACEVCHGPAAGHANDPTASRPTIPRERGACLYCHEFLPSRPTGFPQIIEKLHNPMKPCTNCHHPHDPTPPHVPSTCAACHGQIFRVKSISHHNGLECKTCHDAPAKHSQNPRLYLPKKPATREFCGKCHARDARSPQEIPRIDLATHGGRYVCWECHYPHFPEAS